MRTSIAGAAILLAGVGATTVAAVTSGNNIALNGSDTLFDVTRDVITACGTQFPGATGFATKGITYEGGGSGVGAGQMGLGHQEIAPMSRSLKNGEYCGANQGFAADLLVGIDGVAIVTSKSSSCSTATVNTVGTGLAFGGYTLGAVANIPHAVDALRLIFMGIDQTGVQNCNSATRKTLIQNWTNLFTTDPSCGGGDAHCTTGATHAWRRSDTSGTTDGFVGVLTANAGAGVALGTMSTAPTGAAQKKNPFCNSFEANDSSHQAQFLDGTALLSDGVTTTPMSDGRVNDSSDHDPIRTPCDGNDAICGNAGQCYKQTTQATCLATSAQCTWNGTSCATTNDLGVVLPVFIPDVAYGTTELFPATDCSGSCALLPVITGGALPIGYKCQNGTNPIAGRCWVPVIDTTGKDPRCLVTDPTTRCFGTPGPLGAIDGRVWNKNTMVLTSEVAAAYRFAGATYQVGLDRNNRLMDGSFYRQHMRTPSSYNTRAVDANYTGQCHENDDTSQIGCLVDADDCSVGYAGREAAKTFPGSVTDPNKALIVDGHSPFDSGVLTNLVGSGPVYELARRLYLATGPGGVGFAGLPASSGEQMLAQCYSKDSLVGPAITAHGYIQVPAISCIDYPETAATSTPLVNTQGAGNVALAGCASATNTDACVNVDNAHGFLFGL
jgi:ABC-type phosphate transport system substrate-binding protein